MGVHIHICGSEPVRSYSKSLPTYALTSNTMTVPHDSVPVIMGSQDCDLGINSLFPSRLPS